MRSIATGQMRSLHLYPAAYSTAENMLHRASVGAERVLVTGASGGVGSAAVQLCKWRGAYVIAISSASKADEVRALGADEVIDLVTGPQWPSMLELCALKPIRASRVRGQHSIWLDLHRLPLSRCTCGD
ncbi:zinc-binding dehydrogenase [Ruegeria atlantica]|uniref:zinc-binding dehydrogenase n=1 Tax=Ruegeria atlantica TaxID=81569 RepID=UPI0034A059E6